MKKLILIILLFCVLPSNLSATNLADCERTTVVNALFSASSGDIFTCPANGENTYTWTSGVTIPDGVTLEGAGAFDASDANNTVITSSSYIWIILGSGSKLKNMKFLNGVAHPELLGGKQNWIIKDNYFGNTGDKQDIGINDVNAAEPTEGVYHGNTFIGVSGVVSGQGTGIIAWSEDTNFGGTDGTVYLENNIFDLDDYGTRWQIWDANMGARVVFRFNEIHNGYISIHGSRNGTTPDQKRRSARLMEWYGNNFIQLETYSYHATLWSRGGGLMMFNNDCTGHSSRCQYWVDTERVIGETGINGWCDTADVFDTVPHPKSGAIGCRDIIGMGKDSSPSPSPLVNLDQVDQTYEPSYIWNDTYTTSTQVPVHLHNYTSSFVSENIDFFQGDGTEDAGVRWGTLAAAPTCTESTRDSTHAAWYDGYWATDQGTWNQSVSGEIGYGEGSGVLYQCDPDTTTWESYYTPAVYPHALVQADEDAPATPWDVTVHILGAGSGTVTSTGGLNFTSGFDTDSVINGEHDIITATPTSPDLNGDWGGDCSGSSATPCDLTVDGNKTVYVTFNKSSSVSSGAFSTSGATQQFSPSGSTWKAQ